MAKVMAKKSTSKNPSAYAAPPVQRSRFQKLRRTKQPKPKQTKLSGSFRLMRDSLLLILEHKRLFSGIMLVYVLVTIVMTGGLGAGISVTDTRNQIREAGGESLSGSLSVFGMMLSSVGGSTESSAAYQTLIVITVSLAIIWSLRQIMASQKTSVREAFYDGMTPLVPFILILFVVGLQLVPFLLAGTIYQATFNTGFAVGVVEKTLWATLSLTLLAASVYMLSSSVFALYIVTLPDMKPIQALRSARGLTRYRRWSLARKLLFLPLALLFIGALIIVPLILIAPVLAQLGFIVLMVIGLVIVHTYLYHLYRELL